MLILQTGVEDAIPEALGPIQELAIKFGVRLIIDLLTVFILIRFIYYPINKHKELFFTFFIFNIIIFLMCFFMNRVKMSMGAAFGLFAVFGMLRYRTEDLSIKDMTYLFLVIAIGLITAVTKLDDIPYYYEFVLVGGANVFILILTYLLEGNLLMRKETAKIIVYEKIELIKPERRAELIADLEARMGIRINRIGVAKVDFLRDTAQIKIYYYED